MKQLKKYIWRKALTLSFFLTPSSLQADPLTSVKPPTIHLVEERANKADNLSSLDASVNQFLRSVLEVTHKELKKTKRSLSDEMELKFAIGLLGKYRFVEAVQFLVKNITFQSNGITLAFEPFGNLPATTALIDIGNPSVQEILRRMKPQLNTAPEYPERDLHLFAYVIRQVDGDEVGLFRLQLAAKNAQGTHKINLLNLIDIYKLNENELQIRQAIDDKPSGKPAT